MTEPDRLALRRGGDELARALHADAAFAPPAGAEEALWAALSSTLAATSLTTAAQQAGPHGAVNAGATGLAPQAGVLAGGAVLKGLAVGLSAGLLVAGGYVATSRARGPQATAQPSVVAFATLSRPGSIPSAPAAAVEPVAAEPVAPEPASAETGAAEPSSASLRGTRAERSAAGIASTANTVNTPSSANTPNAVALANTPNESVSVLAARDALRSGNAAQALQILKRADSDYPRGQLSEERAALAIDALLQLGSRQIAVARARSFVRRFPESPQAARMRELAGDFAGP